MGINENDQKENIYMEIDDQSESSYEKCDSDDSDFDIENEVRQSFSRLSVSKKFRSRITKVTEEEGGEEAQDATNIDVPELGEEDQKSFEAVQKKIEAGELEKLKVDQCKVYLRKYGLRLMGKKEILLQRIKEHLEIVNDSGEIKYPKSSFLLNCKGDACMGDVVLFEQNVYETFSIASRSATGPPCGTRIIAGRIVKESYGAEKQQHTFTIEVLWSKGVKPLPPLHPLLIKGRNLYRLNTMRQKWGNEAERQKILFEKHSRGDFARSLRNVRNKEKEMRKMLKTNRAPKMEKPKGKKEETKVDNQFTSLSSSIYSGILGTGPQGSQNILNRGATTLCPSVHLAAEKIDTRQNFTSVLLRNSFHNQNRGQSMNPSPSHHQFQMQHSTNMPLASSTYHNKNHTHGYSIRSIHSQYDQFQMPRSHETNIICSPLRGPSRRPLTSTNCIGQSQDFHSFQQRSNYEQNGNSYQNQSFEKKQLCKFYAQGRCYYGDRCKWLHEERDTHT